jgi:S-adenosylmethionine:tRNA ribosyltransferase-isomerase
MLTADFDYELPADRIAQHPAPRGTSRLLVLDADGANRHKLIRDLPSLLQPGDLLVVNDTRVIPARLFARREPTGGSVEVLLAEQTSEHEWTCLLKPARRARPGTLLTLSDDLQAEVIRREGDGRHHIRFSTPVGPHLATLGHVPLPPYIKRPDEPRDEHEYQTVFANRAGAIAAPTAGLHFDDTLLRRLEEAGIACTAVTLHVGIGTFKPVTTSLVHEHRMDSERYEISADTVEAIERTRAMGGRVVAVGTTVVRTLEGCALAHDGRLVAGPARTELFITPGFEFQIVDVLLTNFHLPRSTLLMLVSAFAGRERVLTAYEEAIREGYRFYSYGDAMLAERRA